MATATWCVSGEQSPTPEGSNPTRKVIDQVGKQSMASKTACLDMEQESKYMHPMTITTASASANLALGNTADRGRQ